MSSTLIDNTARITFEDINNCLVNLEQVVFEVTDACNLSCSYCAYGPLYGGYDKRDSRQMQISDAQAVLDYLVSIWSSNTLPGDQLTTAVSFYGGEPLMNISLIEKVVDYVESLDINRKFFFSMTSNCLLLDRYMDYLVEHDFYILCSLDGDKNSDAYRMRKDGTPSFDKVFSNLKLLQNRYPDYFRTHISFNAVLHNLNSVQKTASFIEREFGMIPMLSELSVNGIRPEKREEFERAFHGLRESFASFEEYDPVLSDLFIDDPNVLDLNSYLRVHLDNSYSDYLQLFLDAPDTKRTPSSTCIPFLKKMFVKVDGKILQCEQISHHHELGKVEGGRVFLDTQSIANWFNALLDRIQKLCSTCSLKQECPVCILKTDEMEGESPKCPYFMTSAQYDQLCNSRKRYLKEHPQLYKKIIEKLVIQ